MARDRKIGVTIARLPGITSEANIARAVTL